MIYGLASTVTALGGFLLFPFYSRALGPVGYGVQDLVMTVVSITSLILIMGLDNASARFFYDSADERDKRAILSTWLWFQVAVSVLAVAAVAGLSQDIAEAALSHADYSSLLMLGIAAVPFAMISRVGTMTLRLYFRATSVALAAVVATLVNMSVGVALVVYAGIGVRGVLIAFLATNTCNAAVTVIMARRHFCWRLDWRRLGKMLTFGLPFVPASLGLWLLTYASRFFLLRYAGPTEIGMLAVGSKICFPLTFLLGAFQLAWGPFAYSLVPDLDHATTTYARALRLLFCVAVPILTVLTLFAGELIAILASSEFLPAAGVVPWVGVGTVLWAGCYIVGMGYGIARRSYHVTIAVVVAAGVAVACMAVFVPRWGAPGAAASTAIGYIFAFAYTLEAGGRYLRVKYDWRSLGALASISIVACLLGLVVSVSTASWAAHAFLLKLAIITLYAIALLAFRVVSLAQIRLGVGAARSAAQDLRRRLVSRRARS